MKSSSSSELPQLFIPVSSNLDNLENNILPTSRDEFLTPEQAQANNKRKNNEMSKQHLNDSVRSNESVVKSPELKIPRTASSQVISHLEDEKLKRTANNDQVLLNLSQMMTPNKNYNG